ALTAAENQGPAVSKVREAIWHALGQANHWLGRSGSPIASRIEPVLSHADTESDVDVRLAFYDACSRSGLDEAHERIVRGLRKETPRVREFLAAVLGRHPRSVEFAVREIVRSWPEERVVAEGIIEILEGEFLRVPHEWLADAPEEVRERMAKLVE
ncbi:MAG: hypothetical protein AAGF12_22310, partial [Myxococcota bacterium]